MANRILIIAYHFPPEISGGVGRPHSLHKYLPRHGIRPTVITHEAYGKIDGERNVVRCNSLADWRRMKLLSPKVFLKAMSKGLNLVGLLVSTDIVWEHEVNRGIGCVLAKNGIEGVYATYPPVDALMLGVSISRKYNLPFLSEFRDGMAFEPLQKYNIVQKARMEEAENTIVNNSKVVVTVGKKLTRYFRGKYDRDSVFTVYNGYDQDDFEGLRTKEPKSFYKTKMVHFGRFNASRGSDIRPLLTALRCLKYDGIIEEKKFELSLIGRYTREEHDLVSSANVGDVIVFYPEMNKRDGFRKIVSEYTFLLFYGVKGQTTIVSSKLLEYIRLGKPILGICKGNEAEEIIRDTGTGEVCDFNVESIYALFRKFIESRYIYDPKQDKIARFDRTRQAGQIADIVRNNLLN
jgi:glycosyltransferase involved in cell wall biosynthesis